MTETNWAGNHTYGAERFHRPRSHDELLEIVAAASKVKAVGSRHSFTDIGDSLDVISLDALPDRFEVASDRSTVTVSGHVTYGDLARRLAPHGLALHNLASLPHITIAGAVATGTHGSGDGNGNLATSVVGIELASSSGRSVTSTRGEPDFPGMIVSMGALGVVTALTLSVEPAFEVRQYVSEEVPWSALEGSFDAVFSSGYSVSAFTRFGPSVDQLWVKRRVDEPGPHNLFGGRAATVDRHPIVELSADGCTRQLDEPGPWSDRLPHFRMEYAPNVGQEIQSEFFIPREFAPAGVEAMRAVADELAPALMISEIRTVAADDLWLSPHHDRDSVAFHFTWRPDQRAADAAAVVVERALAPFAPRPHWGKVFTAETFAAADHYDRLGDFGELTDRLDPEQAFRNRWLERVLG